MIICGIDPSLNSTSVYKFFLDDKLNVVDSCYLGFSVVKKWERIGKSNKIIYFRKKDFNSLQRMDFMIENILDFVKNSNYISIEGYSFGSTGAALFDIGEMNGLIKYNIVKNTYAKLRIYDPKSIKKFATGNGNSDKISVYESYLECNDLYKIDLRDLPNPEKRNGVSPTSDIIDAYYVTKLLYTEILLRNGLVFLKDFNEKTISIFNRVTEKNPTNILDTNFLTLGN